MSTLLALVFSISLIGQTVAPAPAVLSAAEQAIAAGVTVETIKEATTALAAPEMEGRGTMQPGGEKAARWIADRFQKLGLKPLGDKGSYLQKVGFKELVATSETSFKLGDTALSPGTDFAVSTYGANREASGDVVFIGYGMVSEQPKRNDLGDMNLSGKIVVMLEGPPKTIPKKVWDEQDASRIFTRYIMSKQPAALVYIGHGREENPPETNIDYLSRRQITLASEEAPTFPIPPMVWVAASAAPKLFEKSGMTLADALAKTEEHSFTAIKLNQKAKVVAKYKSTGGHAYNVAGVIEGSDPKLKEQAILFSAHYDAFGLLNGKVYAGAADNALGVAEMLAVAEAYTKLAEKPKRSMVFLAVTGEEYGLYGSKYWAKHPTWDIKKVAANLNLDGIGTEVYGPVKTIVGYGAEHSTLGAMMSDVAGAMQITAIPDPIPEEKIFLRSDHYSFVERGVPALMLMGAPAGDKEVWLKRIRDWQKTDYHQPTDVVKSDWAWEGAEAVAEIMGIMGWRISQSEAMPAWLSTSRFGKLQRGHSGELPPEK